MELNKAYRIPSLKLTCGSSHLTTRHHFMHTNIICCRNLCHTEYNLEIIKNNTELCQWLNTLFGYGYGHGHHSEQYRPTVQPCKPKV